MEKATVKTRVKTRQSDVRNRTLYKELVSYFPPRIIHDEHDYMNTLAVMEELVGHELNEDQEDYMELLSELVEAYEAQTCSAAEPIPGNVILATLLEEHGLSARDLSELLGVTPSIAYRILKGTRSLTVEHLSKLSRHFCVSSDLFLAPSRIITRKIKDGIARTT